MRICIGIFVGILTFSSTSPAQEEGLSRNQWLATKSKIESTGFVFDLQAHSPANALEPADNFAAHPLIAENFTHAARKDPGSTRLGKIDLRSVPDFPKPPLGFRTSPHRLFDLASRAGDAKLDRDQAAKILLRALDTWKEEFLAVAEASGRPGCRFPFTWQRPMLEVNYLVPGSLSSHLCWRALSHLQLRQTEQAAADTTTLLELGRHQSSNPSGLGLLATISANESAIRAIRDGIELRRWDDESLASFDQELARIDYQSQLERSFRFELAFSERISMDWIGGKLTADDFAPRTPKGLENPDVDAIYARLNSATKAIFDIVFEGAPNRPIPLPDRLRKMSEYAGAPGDRNDAQSAVATKYSFGIRCLRNQARVNQARLAIAIERARLKDGKLPEDLGQLSPNYLEKVPEDPVTGEPLRFGVLPDASILIYSVGWDGDDDGGSSVAPRGNRDGDGDWVWKMHQAKGAK